MLRTIAICYRDFPSWPPADPALTANRGTILCSSDPYPLALSVRFLLNNLCVTWSSLLLLVLKIFLAVHEAVTVKTCTVDNVLTARSIAFQCTVSLAPY